MALSDFSSLAWVPKFVYEDCGVPSTCTLTIPQGKWRYNATGRGGADEAASGVTESFVYRHDRHLRLRLRFTEEEWVENLEPMFRILWDQAQSFTVQLDKSSTSTVRSAYLISPRADETATPDFNPYDGVLEMDMEVRSADGTHWSYPYFPSLST